MKATLLVIVFAAIAAGWWQAQELSRLKQRETELRASSSGGAESAETVATKSSRRDAKPTLDGAAFVALLTKSLEKGAPPSEEERMFLRDQIGAASGRELKQWAVALRDSQLPDELKKDILVSIAPRIAENDPKLAAELVLMGEDGNPFRSVMRTWLVKDAATAAAWLAEIDPPKFRSSGDFDFPALSLAAKVAADPAQLDALLESDKKRLLAALQELSPVLAPSDFARVLHRVSRDSKLSENNRQHVIGGAMARYRDPALARQILLEAALPAEQFVPVAASMIQSLDPTASAAGVEWVKSLPDPSQREKLLRILEVQKGP